MHNHWRGDSEPVYYVFVQHGVDPEVVTGEADRLPRELEEVTLRVIEIHEAQQQVLAAARLYGIALRDIPREDGEENAERIDEARRQMLRAARQLVAVEGTQLMEEMEEDE